ncbi:NAD(P)-dependent alcohol dehydrogenase [Rhizobium leguminosarum]|uniref:zinc-dependent alcohol dehydrogenase family protein n=1 Tax=Rhizobium leguminosarum TaxID=384 RepID=UPI001031303B|nr:NAD(P)-dependent alcohol dehydrogenase [Rhizobium leguminosarum]QIO74465.1 NAD(P)-dependent alcohol dehydrogenase [Rhizobium leguminosarum bv. trifolii]QIO81484.1 NAD(P)-dependent alcohol dehydrogenase [Rhizobium leguminosarum bv. trifolii]TAU22021.1 NAD(P)-dependent alcohol dehydrogenase [Rhizobium leguminosarum]TAU42023.1 NAD(P)-dependent alcohol dehydrogenase [Rhizobium leguminosarum]TAZ63184.1 NAD(P)-dependent alcohol dehydrogenase [Rhizobium leguminosarum]
MQTTRQWQIDTIGPERQVTIGERRLEPISGNKVLVRTEAVSLNFRDRLVLESGMGLPLQFPFVPASDMAGVVEAVGPEVSRFKPGDRVISTFSPDWIDGRGLGDARTPPYKTRGGFYPGVLSQYTVLSEEWYSRAPETLDAAQASTLPCAGLTAWFALIERGGLKAGDKVLVQGTGGVALFGLQIAKAHGAVVFITSGSAEKLGRAAALGADHVINRHEGDWVEQLYQLTGGYGADHVLEIVGGPHLGQALKAVAINGRISVIGVLEGFEVSGPAGPLLLKAPVVQGISVGHRRALEDLVQAIDQTGLKPVIDKRYAFDEFPEALDHLYRGPFGKVVIEF